MKLKQACLTARNDGESCFHHCGGLGSSCRLVLVPAKIEKAVFTTVEVL